MGITTQSLEVFSLIDFHGQDEEGGGEDEAEQAGGEDEEGLVHGQELADEALDEGAVEDGPAECDEDQEEGDADVVHEDGPEEGVGELVADKQENRKQAQQEDFREAVGRIAGDQGVQANDRDDEDGYLNEVGEDLAGDHFLASDRQALDQLLVGPLVVKPVDVSDIEEGEHKAE